MGQMIRLHDAVKVYPLEAGEVRAVDRLSLDVVAGEFIAVVGDREAARRRC